MGLLLFLVDNVDPAAEVGPAVAQRLAALGVTNLSVLRDEHTTALALQGWTFDPTLSADAAAHALSAVGGTVRVLRPVVESEIHRAPESPRGTT
ncbi:MAG TPA: hypothetical protein VGK78_07640 [Nocardioides sp.]|uniref:hypothetical protein n=1 Tax=Nocardioides sp. TaxID=35761 RepID=UPI002F40DAFA